METDGLVFYSENKNGRSDWIRTSGFYVPVVNVLNRFTYSDSVGNGPCAVPSCCIKIIACFQDFIVIEIDNCFKAISMEFLNSKLQQQKNHSFSSF